MENLAGNKDADRYIKEELYLAGIPEVKVELTTGEVPYTIIGKLGKWTFRRAWYYWVASVENSKDGIILAKAIALHERKHPTNDKMKILGNVIRVDGNCTCPSPKNSYVDLYHIDDQVGLVEFAKAIAPDCYKHCGDTQPSLDNTICLNCGSGIISEK